MTEKLKPVIEYYDDGTIKYAYRVDENGIEQGPYEEYHDNGRLKEKCTYKDGKYDGPYESYYDNGQLWEKCTYKDGKYDGPYEEYYEDGQLGIKCTYNNGKEDGPCETYYGNGQLNEKGVYRMGERLYGKEAKEYLKEWNEKHNSKEARKGLNARLRQISKKMPATAERQSAKRAEVAKFRKNHPDKHAGRVIEKKNWLQKLFRGGR